MTCLRFGDLPEAGGRIALKHRQAAQGREPGVHVFDGPGSGLPRVLSTQASVLIQTPGLVPPELLVELVPIAVIPFDRYHEPER